MTKTYSTKHNAARAFRSQFKDVAGDMGANELAEAGHIDEDEPGKWVLNDPAVAAQRQAEEEAVEQARADAEHAAREQVRLAEEQAKRDADAAVEAGAHPMLAGKAAPAALQVHNTALPKAGNDNGKCPHCDKSTRDGDNVTDYSEMSPGSQNSTTQQFTCNDCAGEWGPVVDKPKKARAPSGSSNGLKIEKDREQRNGVTRPSAGGKCRGIWDMLDGIGTGATAKEARETGLPKGFDKTTIMVQFYRWRKFNGIEGRQ